ncbi:MULTISPECIES: type I-E CRISPR-associated protein Cas7/Cse4/CasC [unclassified Cobetia]|uniref:type I-E CRISPR-associated protein Cas7/Cse4/CasC n=1 Tax=unclassified Cobetia TaxID=2609414 RepID=UPI002097CD8B|nr:MULTISPECIES: type I-E CRISPR-associated protein Cas7/Cse4/CasC [unclassified Cobetia]MCO7231766.1 type I-E CRISPR-associated protein Cas7/Cse4/CasC [Cobetia sp. Dlab-2-AX]MCO7234918.1 type I-E CRISPR-associated protein Cas7/Cse4/CasC [Cobetia sp. Dlab-2-U]
MSHFIQLHLLTSYPPANLNRDDLGRPKTAIMGGAKRLRVSSQSLKRTWRTSALFEEALGQHRGQRTKRVGIEAHISLLEKGVKEKDAKAWATEIAKVFGDVAKNELATSQLVHIGPEEQAAVDALIETLAAENRAPDKADLDLLRHKPAAADIALFGRMLAAVPAYNVEAACQVAHAITVHAAEVEDDYFTAVDDLNTGDEHRGAAHVGEAGFGAGLFYTYICIDRRQLVDNLQDNSELAERAIAALVEAAVRTSPKGKQNSFGSRAHASYVLAEQGDQMPRSLSAAFLRPIAGQDQSLEAIARLERQAKAFDTAYGPGAERRFVVSAEPNYSTPDLDGEVHTGSLASLIEFLHVAR